MALRFAGLAIGILSVTPAAALALVDARRSLVATAIVIAACCAVRGCARMLAPDLARGYLLSRFCSLRYLLPVLALPVLGGAAIARFGGPALVAVLVGQVMLARHYQACWTRPGALKVACLPALVGGLYCALECLALRGPEMAFGGRLLYAEQSHLQRIVLLEYAGALELFIDGELQFCSSDERVYHQALLEPALAQLARGAHVLVMGGGDGLAARDLLRHESVARVTIVDWDRGVTRLFRSEPELRALSCDALRNSRVEIVHRDIRSVLHDRLGPFDLIVGDLTDPDPNGMGATVTSSAFYVALRAQLSERGAIVTHTSSSDGLAADAIPLALQQAGFDTHCYTVDVPSFQRISYVLATLAAHEPIDGKTARVR